MATGGRVLGGSKGRKAKKGKKKSRRVARGDADHRLQRVQHDGSVEQARRELRVRAEQEDQQRRRPDPDPHVRPAASRVPCANATEACSTRAWSAPTQPAAEAVTAKPSHRAHHAAAAPFGASLVAAASASAASAEATSTRSIAAASRAGLGSAQELSGRVAVYPNSGEVKRREHGQLVSTGGETCCARGHPRRVSPDKRLGLLEAVSPPMSASLPVSASSSASAGSACARRTSPAVPSQRRGDPRLRSGEPSCGLDTVEHRLLRAAELLISADYILIAAGAGFSADSGLKVYKDIANVEAYKKMRLTYGDLCTPDWLQRDPELFFGFWGSCFNDYMDTSPHAGYHICREWCETLNVRRAPKEGVSGDAAAQALPRALQRLSLATQAGKSAGDGHGKARRKWSRGVDAPVKKCDIFVYTSNVDTAFERVGFPREQVLEIHGNCCDWQCAKPDRCREDTWRIPRQHRFEVYKDTMRSPRWTFAPDQQAARRQTRSPVLPILLPAQLGMERGHSDSDEDASSSSRPSLHSASDLVGASASCCARASEGALHAVQGPTVAVSSSPSDGARVSGVADASNRQSLHKPSPRGRSPSALVAAAHAVAPTSSSSPLTLAPKGLSPYSSSSSHAMARPIKSEARGDKVLNHIRCPCCGRAARPNVLMFDDEDWVPVETKAYKTFAKNAVKSMEERGAKLVIVEGGCGKRVPTVRLNSEKLVARGAHLIRINLDYPSAPCKAAGRTIPLQMNVLPALQGIDAAIKRLMGPRSVE